MSESKTLPTRRHPRAGRTTTKLGVTEFVIMFTLFVVVHSLLTAVGIPGLLVWIVYSLGYAALTYSKKGERLRDRLWDRLYPGGQP